MIDTIFFDVGGTLLDPDLPRMLTPLPERARPTAEQLAAADRAAKHAIPPRTETGAAGKLGQDGPVNKGHWTVFFETLLKAVDCEDLLGEMLRRAGDSAYWTLLDAAVPPVLAELKRGYRLAVISNADGRIDRVLQAARIADFFEQIIDSGRVGLEKPDPRVFGAALEAMGSQAERSLYVGDIYGIDYCGATAVGMQAVLLDRTGVYDGWPVECLRSLTKLPAWLAAR